MTSPTTSRRVAGIDGCRGGWVVARVDAAGAPTGVEVVADLGPVFAEVADGSLAAIGIDIPIGLPARGVRAADREARSLLGPRRSSLFATPAASVVDATSYDEANRRARALDGKGLSMQAFGLFPRIREVRDLLDPALAPAVAEVHPETSFAVLAGGPLAHPKRRAEGRAERIAALAAVFGDVAPLVGRRPRGAAADDVLDSLAAAWTARRMAAGTARWLGDLAARDDRGFPLSIAV